jgi:hypothetical protein
MGDNITITYPDHSGHQHKMTFASASEALAHLQSLEATHRHEQAVAPTSSGRITCDRRHQMEAFRVALGLNRYRFSDER